MHKYMYMTCLYMCMYVQMHAYIHRYIRSQVVLERRDGVFFIGERGSSTRPSCGSLSDFQALSSRCLQHDAHVEMLKI